MKEKLTKFELILTILMVLALGLAFYFFVFSNVDLGLNYTLGSISLLISMLLSGFLAFFRKVVPQWMGFALCILVIIMTILTIFVLKFFMIEFDNTIGMYISFIYLLLIKLFESRIISILNNIFK